MTEFNPENYNALLFTQEGDLSPLKVDTFEAMAGILSRLHECNYVEMARLLTYPIDVKIFDHPKKIEELELFRTALDYVLWSKDLTPTAEHVEKMFGGLQLFVHEFGAVIPLEKNPFFDDGTEEVLYGDVILLLVDCDSIPYEIDQENE